MLWIAGKELPGPTQRLSGFRKAFCLRIDGGKLPGREEAFWMLIESSSHSGLRYAVAESEMLLIFR